MKLKYMLVAAAMSGLPVTPIMAKVKVIARDKTGVDGQLIGAQDCSTGLEGGR